MSHDFIVAKGKLNSDQIYAHMNNCVSHKHEMIKKFNGEIVLGANFGPVAFERVERPEKSAHVEYFHGFHGGIFYKVFNAERFNNGMSGSGEAITQNGKQVKKKIKVAADKVLLESSDPFNNMCAKNLLQFCEKLSDDELLTVIFC